MAAAVRELGSERRIMNIRCHRTSLPRWFTLIELMLAISMMLILMIGVNYVFRSAASAKTKATTIAER